MKPPLYIFSRPGDAHSLLKAAYGVGCTLDSCLTLAGAISRRADEYPNTLGMSLFQGGSNKCRMIQIIRVIPEDARVSSGRYSLVNSPQHFASYACRYIHEKNGTIE